MKKKFLEKWKMLKLNIMSFFTKIPVKDPSNAESTIPSVHSEDVLKKYEARRPVDNSRELVSIDEGLDKFEPFEPKRPNRFIVRFPNIKEYLINRYQFHGNLSMKKMSNGKKKARELSSITIYLTVLGDEDLEILKMAKKKSIGFVSVQMVQASGDVIREICLNNCKIEKVDIYSDLDWNNNSLVTATIEFSHDPRVFK